MADPVQAVAGTPPAQPRHHSPSPPPRQPHHHDVGRQEVVVERVVKDVGGDSYPMLTRTPPHEGEAASSRHLGGN
jgi:hypothetical protein